MLRLFFCALGLLLPACGSESIAAKLTPSVGDLLFAVEAPRLPDPVRPPNFLPCPAGWRETSLSSATVCEPWPDTGHQNCADDEAHFLGQPGCQKIGSACPVQDWADDLPVTGVHYVKAGAGPGGDGSRQAPFATVDEATLVAQPSDVIALSKGTHVTFRPIPSGVTVWGACVGQTAVSVKPATEAPASLVVVASGVAVRNLRITGAKLGVVVEGAEAQLHLRDVLVEGVGDFGMAVNNAAQVSAENLVVRTTGSNGLGVYRQASFEGRRVVIENATSQGLIVTGVGTKATLEEGVVRNTRPSSDKRFGRGLEVAEGAAVTARRLVVEKSYDVAVLVAAGAQLNLSDAVIRDTQPNAGTNLKGHGLTVDQSTVHATRVRFERNTDYGVIAGGAGTQLTLTDAAVAFTRPAPTTKVAVGLGLTLKSAATLERVLAYANEGYGLSGGSAGTTLSATDLAVIDTVLVGENEVGISLVDGVKATLMRTLVQRSGQLAMMVGSADTEVTASDLTLVGPDVAAPAGGQCLSLAETAQLHVTKALLLQCRMSGIYAADQSALIAEDLTVRDTQLSPTNGGGGIALMVVNGASARGTRWSFLRSKLIAMWATGAGTRIEASEARIQGTVKECSGHTGCEEILSAGVVASEKGSIALSRFLVADNGGFGLQLVEGGEIDLADGEVAFHDLAINARTEGFDAARLDQRVVYRHNTRKLDSVNVPLPAIPKPF